MRLSWHRKPGAWLAAMALVMFAAILGGASLSNRHDIGNLRRDLGIVRNCEIARSGRINGNEQRAILQDYLIKSRQIERKERPFIKALLPPDVEKLMRQQRKLLNELIKAEHPLPIPICTPSERPH